MSGRDRCRALETRQPFVRASPAVSDLSAFLRVLAARHGQRAAVVDDVDTLSFAALDESADVWARALCRSGAGPGTHVGLLAANGTTWLAAAFGVWRAGATLVPISTFVTERELSALLDHADISILILQERFRQHDYAAMLGSPAVPMRLREVVALGSEKTRIGEPASSFLRRGAAHPGGLAPIDPAGIACILYTSGTTGQPKGVMLAHAALLATAAPTAERSGLSEHDRLLSTLPLFWVAGLVIRALPTLAAGCTLILTDVFTPGTTVKLLRRHRPTALHLRPPQVGQLLADPSFDATLLAHVHRGNGRVEWYAPHLDPERCRFITGYGMTEMSGYVTALDWRDPAPVRSAQLGTPLPGVSLRIVRAGGQACSPGESGEIWIRGPGLFAGYYKEPVGTSMSADGYLQSGDLGCIDAAGSFHFTGRVKDLLRVKGINVSPIEVETVLATHPAVEAVYIVGLPADSLEQELVALVVPRPSAGAHTEAELQQLARRALSHYKRPGRYLFIDRREVSLSGTSKPQRAALAELAAARALPFRPSA
jgi:acyl-CoA synthetase (AMP-forming)/AMP-acid ligase II